MNDFIMTIPNAARFEYCDYLIDRFEFYKETRAEGSGKVMSRQALEEDITKLQKEDDTLFLGGDAEDRTKEMWEDKDVHLYGTNVRLLEELVEIIWNCYNQYSSEWNVLRAISKHYISPTVRIQKTKPGQGYHIWHADGSDIFTSRRVMVMSLFLNDVKEGGETEFLYQHKRIYPEKGMMVIFPSAWTHTHRGNPPLSGDKYIATTWLELGHSE